MENKDIIIIVIVVPGHYRHSYTLEVLEMNNFICLGYHGIYLKRKTCNNDNFCHGQLQTHLFTSGEKVKYKYGGGFYLQRANMNCKSPADEAFRDVLVVSCQNLC